MILIQFAIYAIGTLGLVIFIKTMFIPYISKKILIYKIKRIFKELAKKYPEIPELEKAIDIIDEINKNQKL